MPRVNFVKKAAKDYPSAGIKKGESYYWWKFRYGGKHKSKTPPRSSQLTQSEFLSQMYEIQEEIEDYPSFEADGNDDDKENFEGWCSELASARDDWAQRIRDLGEECQEKKDNMPEGLQEGEVGQMLEERHDTCDGLASDLENVDCEPGAPEVDEDDEDDDEGGENPFESAAQEILDELQGLQYEGP